MARKNNLIELTLEVKRKGTEQIGKYKKELFELKKAANDLNKTLNATQKQLKQDVQNTSVKTLSKDSEKAQAQIKKLEATLKKVTEELKDQKKAQSDLKKESNAKIQEVKAGAKAELKAYKESQSALKKKRREEEKSNKTGKESAGLLSRLGNATATVNGPLNDFSGRVNSLAAGFKAFNPLAVIALTTISALAFAIPGATRAFAQMERQLGRIDALLKQTGNSAGFTVNQFENMAQELALNTLTSLTQTRDAIGLILSFPNIRGDNFERVLELSQDIAEVTGRDLKSASEQVAKAVTDPIKGITRLTEVGVVFTKEQERMIRSAQALNGTFAAQEVILDVLASQYGGAAEGAAQGLAGTLDTIAQRFENIQLKLGELANDTGVLQYLQTLTLNVENLLGQLSRVQTVEDFFNVLEESFKTTTIEQKNLLNSLIKLQDEVDKFQERGNKGKAGKSSDGIDFETRFLGFNEKNIRDLIKKDLDLYGRITEDTIKEYEDYQKRLENKIKDNIEKTQKNLEEDQSKNIQEQLNFLLEQGKLTQEQFKEASEEFNSLDTLQGITTPFDIIADNTPDFLVGPDRIAKTLNSGIDNVLEAAVLSDEQEEILRKSNETYAELQAEKARILEKNNKELAKLRSQNIEAFKSSAEKELKERAEETQKIEDQLNSIRNEYEIKRLKQEARANEEAARQRLKYLRERQRLDTDNIGIQNEIVETEAEQERNQLQVRTYELTLKQLNAQEKLNNLREKFTPDEGEVPTDEKIGLVSPEFVEQEKELETINNELQSVNDKIGEINEITKIRRDINIELNEEKIQKQIDTVLEDTSIKQKELIARLQGNTEESLDSQLTIIDEKYDKILKNLEERIGEIPSNVAQELSDQQSLEKANAELDFAKDRIKDLSTELKEGKISVESYATSIDQLEARIEKLSKQTGVAIQDLETNDIYKEYAEKRLKEVGKEIDTILDKVEEADLSEGLTLKQEAFDRLNDLKKELEEIKRLNPDIDLSKETSLATEINTDISETYDATTKQIAESSKTFVTNLTKNIFDTLKKGESVSFEDVAVSAAYDVSNALLQKQLESITDMLLSPENTASMLEGLKSFFSFVGSSMVDGFAFLKDSASGALSSLFNGLKDFVSNIDFNAVIDTAKQAFKAIFDVIKGLMSGASGGGGAEGSIFSAIGSSIGGFFHTGGLVGAGGGEPIAINNSLLRNASKYHDGGYLSPNSQLKSDEMAAILQKGEYVIDRQTTKNLLNQKSNSNSQGGGSQQIINVVSGDEIANAVSGNGKFNDVIVNTIKNNRSQISEYIKR